MDGNLQTVVQEYRHPGGRTILLVGCVHAAEPGYYEQLRKVVDAAESSGSTVYMEGAFTRADSLADADDDVAAIQLIREWIVNQYDKIPALLDLPWVHQEKSAMFPYPDTWRCMDSGTLDLLRLVGPRNVPLLTPSGAVYETHRQLKESQGADSPAFRDFRKQWVSHYFAMGQDTVSDNLRTGKGEMSDLGRWLMPYIFTFQEAHAALAALKADGDVVLLWHPGHLVGIGRVLVRNDFEPHPPREWLTACHEVHFGTVG